MKTRLVSMARQQRRWWHQARPSRVANSGTCRLEHSSQVKVQVQVTRPTTCPRAWMSGHVAPPHPNATAHTRVLSPLPLARPEPFGTRRYKVTTRDGYVRRDSLLSITTKTWPLPRTAPGREVTYKGQAESRAKV